MSLCSFTTQQDTIAESQFNTTLKECSCAMEGRILSSGRKKVGNRMYIGLHSDITSVGKRALEVAVNLFFRLDLRIIDNFC